jgi:hypothetical protein
MTSITHNTPARQTPATHAARSAALSLVAVATVGLIGWIALRPTPGHAPRAKGARSKVAAPTAKQRAAVDLAYPTPGPSLPGAIAIDYDYEHDRTRMSLTTGGLAARSPAYSLGGITLRWTSEFDGTARRPDAGELSVQCLLTVVSTPEGALASSAPPAEFIADGTTIDAQSSARGKSGYTSKPKPDGSHESLAFKIRTTDLITLANAKSVQLKAGVVTVPFSASHIHDLREFVARMNPRS